MTDELDETFARMRAELEEALDELLTDEPDEFVHDMHWLMKKHGDRDDLIFTLSGLYFLMGAHHTGHAREMAFMMGMLAIEFFRPDGNE